MIMNKFIMPGRIIFALGFIALGVLQLIAGDFIIGRPPAAAWAAHIPGKLAWAYASGCFLIVAGSAIIINKKARLASLLIGAIIILFSFILRHLTEMSDWVNAYKTLALAGGSFIIAATFFKKNNNSIPGNFVNHDLVFTGCIFLSLFFIICGIAHFKFDEFVKDLIPAYIPFHFFWTYFCGIALLATGVGVLIRQTRKWASVLSGFMILLWFFLLHIPRAFAAWDDYREWMGVCESFAFAGIMFTLTGLSSNNNTELV
jgi:uncharacterized membrane protein